MKKIIKDNNVKLFLLLAMISWGTFYPMSKYVLKIVSPMFLSAIRYFYGALIISPFFMMDIKTFNKRIEKNDVIQMIFIGVFCLSAFSLLLFFGLFFSTSSNSSLLANTQPIFAIFLAPLFLKETFCLKKLSASIVGFIGMIFVVTDGNVLSISFQNKIFVGNILLTCAAITLTFYSILIKKYVLKYDGIIPTFITMFSTSIILFLCALFLEKSGLDFVSLFKIKSMMLLTALAIFGTAVPFILFNKSLQYIDIIRASGFKFLIPISGILLSVIFLGERPSLFTYIGMIIVVFSVFFIQRE